MLNKRLADREFIAGEYSIADMASYPWVVPYKNQGQDIEQFPHLKRWLETIKARPATERAYAKAKEVNPNFGQPVNRTEEERQDPVRADRGGGAVRFAESRVSSAKAGLIQCNATSLDHRGAQRRGCPAHGRA